MIFVGSLALSAVAADDMSGNPYTSIPIRNVFSLNPILPGPPEPQSVIKITPNGIMTIFGVKQALFKASGNGMKEQSYILSEGQRQDDITVLKINDKKGTITFDNHGVTQELALANATASGGTAPSLPALNFPAPNNANGSFAARGPGNQRGRNAVGNAGGDAENTGASDVANLRNIPTRNYQPAAEGATMTPEEQVLMIEAQRAYYQAQGNPMAKILPPTAMTPQVTGEGGNLPGHP